MYAKVTIKIAPEFRNDMPSSDALFPGKVEISKTGEVKVVLKLLPQKQPSSEVVFSKVELEQVKSLVASIPERYIVSRVLYVSDDLKEASSEGFLFKPAFLSALSEMGLCLSTEVFDL